MIHSYVQIEDWIIKVLKLKVLLDSGEIGVKVVPCRKDMNGLLVYKKIFIAISHAAQNFRSDWTRTIGLVCAHTYLSLLVGN